MHYKFESKNAASETVRQEEMCECQVDRLGREWPAATDFDVADAAFGGSRTDTDTTYGSSSVSHRLQSLATLTTVLILPTADIVLHSTDILLSS